MRIKRQIYSNILSKKYFFITGVRISLFQHFVFMADNKLTNNLKVVRGAMGLTQEDFAAILKINRTTYAHHEQGNSEPSLSAMQKLMELTGFDLKALTDADLSEIGYEKLHKDILRNTATMLAKNPC